jgi:hypothetical protein
MLTKEDLNKLLECSRLRGKPVQVVYKADGTRLFRALQFEELSYDADFDEVNLEDFVNRVKKEAAKPIDIDITDEMEAKLFRWGKYFENEEILREAAMIVLDGDGLSYYDCSQDNFFEDFDGFIKYLEDNYHLGDDNDQ